MSPQLVTSSSECILIKMLHDEYCIIVDNLLTFSVLFPRSARERTNHRQRMQFTDIVAMVTVAMDTCPSSAVGDIWRPTTMTVTPGGSRTRESCVGKWNVPHDTIFEKRKYCVNKLMTFR